MSRPRQPGEAVILAQQLASMETSVTLRAPAKLNLSLEVLNRVSGGLHALRSVMAPVDLCDEILIAPSENGLHFTCDDATLLNENLVERAYNALGLTRGATIELRKSIPTGAGLGGGSSDAAAILLAAQRGEFGAIPQIDYLATALSLGSDVPFFLAQTAALVEGTGERVTALGRVPDWHAVIVKPPVTVSTAQAYRALDEHERAVRPRNSSASLALGEALQRGQFERVVELLHNDFLEVLAADPLIARALDMLRNAGAVKPMLSGSGSAVFVLVQNADERDKIAEAIEPVPEFQVFPCAFWSGEAWTR